MKHGRQHPPVQPDDRNTGHGVHCKAFSGSIGMRDPRGMTQSEVQLRAELPSKGAYCLN